MFKTRGLTFQLSLLILSSAGIISILLYGYNFFITGTIVYKEVDKNANSIVEKYSYRIESVIRNVEKIAYISSNFLEASEFKREELEQFLIKTVETSDEIYGSSICFEPYQFDSTTKLFSLYYYKDGGTVKYADLSTDAYNYPEQPWYKVTKESDAPNWSEPYMDEGGGNIMMTTFTVPFYTTTSSGKKFMGVITCDFSLEWLKEMISGMKIYQSGYGFLLSKQGTFLAHPDSNFVMRKTIFDIAVEANHPELNELGKRMIAGETGFVKTKSLVLKKNALVRFYPLKINGWSLGLLFPNEEIYEDLIDLGIEVSILGFIGFIILFIVIVWISGRLSKPLNTITTAAEYIAAGDLKTASELSSGYWSKYHEIIEKSNSKNRGIKNEIIRLFASVNQMSRNLNNLINEVQKSGVQVGSSANEITASSRELEANATEQAASTREVSATSLQISQTSSMLSNSIHDINKKTEYTLGIARQGKSSLDSLDEALQNLNRSTQSITGKLSVISERANKISSVVTAINKISEQTNLLSFNAAIEAEKAGEYGRGFSVVAREISRLADQTAVATEDIEKMVREMQSSVSSGVMEMDKFSDEVRKGAGHIYSVANQLGSVIEEVNEFAPSFKLFAEGMEQQTEAAGQISETMIQLAKASSQSKDALSEFRRASLQLNDAVMTLQREVRKFAV